MNDDADHHLLRLLRHAAAPPPATTAWSRSCASTTRPRARPSCSTWPSCARCACSLRPGWCLRSGTVRPSDPPPPPSPTRRTSTQLRGHRRGRTASRTPGWRRPTVLHRARDALVASPRRRPARRHGVHVQEPGAVHRSAAGRARCASRCSSAPGRTCSTDPDDADGDAAVAGRVARYAWVDHYAPLREGLWAVARRLRRDGWKAVAVRRRQLHRRPRGRPPGRHRLVRQERQPAAPRRRQLVRARLRRHHRAAAGGAGAGGRRLRHVPALPRRVPHRRHRRAGRDRRRPLPGLGAAEARHLRPPVPAWRSATASTAATTARRCARRRCGSAQRPRRRAAAERASSRGSTCWRCSTATDDEVLRRMGPLVPGRPRSALAAPQRARRARQHRRRSARDARGASRSLARYLADDDPMLRAHAVWAAAVCGLDHLLPATDPHPDVPAELQRSAAVKHLLVTNDFPPKIGGIQSLLWEWWRRLPPDSFAVLTSPVRGRRRVRRGAAVPHRAHPRAGAAAAPVDGAAHRRDGRARSAPIWSCSTRRCRSGSSARRWSCRTTSCCTAPRSRCPVGCRCQQADARRTCCATPATSSPPAATRPPRPSTRPVGTLPITVVPPGVDIERFHPLDRAERAAARAALRPAGRCRAGRRHQPARAAQGLRHRHPRRRAAASRRGPTWCWPSPAAVATSPPAPAGRRARRAGAVPRPGARTTTCRACTAAPTSTRCCAATGGAASSRRASASCSSRPRRAACRRWPATAAVRPRRSTTA